MSNFQTLNETYLKAVAPSIFAVDQSARVSDKYIKIATWDILSGLAKEGFLPVQAFQCRTRDASRREFVKHTVRLRHTDAVANERGLYPEMVLINSHDGLSSYRLMAGIFRIVCSNGLIAGDMYDEIRIRHQGDILGNIIEGTYSVIDSAQKMLESSENMSNIILSSDEKRVFAESVHQFRFNSQSVEESGIKPEQFLTRRRMADNDDSLFTIMNVAQENLLRGGLRGYALAENGRYRLRSTGQAVKKVSTREITSIDKGVALNRAVWSLAEKMAELKAA